MSKQVADIEVHALEDEDLDEEDGNDYKDVSVDLIEQGLYLGNLVTARDSNTLEKLKITHILTLDLVPLPRTVLDKTHLTFKFVKLADVPKEDLISHLPSTNEFIKNVMQKGGTVLVHCYFGVSRSAAVVIAYIMEKYALCYEDAFSIVKSKRRYIGPNIGFVAQLKLFGHMGYTINREDPRYKQFRLKFAGQKLKQVKILPQQFSDLIKQDPGLVRERPDPLVYRCKKCRRIVASQSNIIPHIPRPVKIELVKKGLRPPPSKITELKSAENGHILIEKLNSLSTQINEMISSFDSGNIEKFIGRERKSDSSIVEKNCVDSDTDITGQTCELINGSMVLPGLSSDNDIAGHSSDCSHGSDGDLVDTSICGRADAPEVCRLMWFVEPMCWMKDVQHEMQGKLHCPKCQTKIGSFSWVMGCRCPCGQKVAPAFYLVPSKVEWSNIVQNVQVTV